MRTGWLQLGCGVSGDMLLGALHDLGAVDATALPAALGLDATVTVEAVQRGGLAATRVLVTPGTDQPARRLDDLLAVIDRAALPPDVAGLATRVLTRLATVEAAVHGVTVAEVHFHEVGAVDSLVDLAGSDVPVHGGPEPVELATPTGLAVLLETVDAWGPLPPLTVDAVGTGAGGHDFSGRANVVRLIVGEAVTAPGVPGEAPDSGTALLLETNVDDMDPRLWPRVLDRLLQAGASDAWLTPILMKKGRPAHTLSVLVAADRADGVREVVLTETTTLGLREHRVAKTELRRSFAGVDVGGCAVTVKLGHAADGRVVNVAPEWRDVEAAADTLGLPAKVVLARAAAAASGIVS